LNIRIVHGWDYRRYIIRQLDLKDKGANDKILDRAQSEFDFTTTKIQQNFSNYSAWHNRSTLLGKLAKNLSNEEREAIVDSEFDLVKNAIYTDPEDQSAWLYDLWLIGRGMALFLGIHVTGHVAVLQALLANVPDIYSSLPTKNRGEEHFHLGSYHHLVSSSGDCSGIRRDSQDAQPLYSVDSRRACCYPA